VIVNGVVDTPLSAPRPAPDAAAPFVALDVNGLAASPRELSALRAITVHQQLSAPARCELSFTGDTVEPALARRLVPGALIRLVAGQRARTLFAGEVAAVEWVREAGGRRSLCVQAYDSSRCGLYLDARAGTRTFLTPDGAGRPKRLVFGENLHEARTGMEAGDTSRSFSGVATGDTGLRPGVRIDVHGLAAGQDGRWVITSARHTIDRRVYLTDIGTRPPATGVVPDDPFGASVMACRPTSPSSPPGPRRWSIAICGTTRRPSS